MPGETNPDTLYSDFNGRCNELHVPWFRQNPYMSPYGKKEGEKGRVQDPLILLTFYAWVVCLRLNAAGKCLPSPSFPHHIVVHSCTSWGCFELPHNILERLQQTLDDFHVGRKGWIFPVPLIWQPFSLSLQQLFPPPPGAIFFGGGGEYCYNNMWLKYFEFSVLINSLALLVTALYFPPYIFAMKGARRFESWKFREPDSHNVITILICCF